MSKFKLIFLFQENVTYFLKLHDRNDNDRNNDNDNNNNNMCG